MVKNITILELEKVARETSLKVLAEADSLAIFRNDPGLVFATLVEDHFLILQMCISDGVGCDSVVLMSTSVSRTTGEVLGVHIHV